MCGVGTNVAVVSAEEESSQAVEIRRKTLIIHGDQPKRLNIDEYSYFKLVQKKTQQLFGSLQSQICDLILKKKGQCKNPTNNSLIISLVWKLGHIQSRALLLTLCPGCIEAFGHYCCFVRPLTQWPQLNGISHESTSFSFTCDIWKSEIP